MQLRAATLVVVLGGCTPFALRATVAPAVDTNRGFGAIGRLSFDFGVHGEGSSGHLVTLGTSIESGGTQTPLGSSTASGNTLGSPFVAVGLRAHYSYVGEKATFTTGIRLGFGGSFGNPASTFTGLFGGELGFAPTVYLRPPDFTRPSLRLGIGATFSADARFIDGDYPTTGVFALGLTFEILRGIGVYVRP